MSQAQQQPPANTGKFKRTRAYAEEAVRLIKQKPGVTNVIVLNFYRNPIITTMDMRDAIRVSGLYETIRWKAEATLKTLNSKPEQFRMLRIRSANHEVIITVDGKLTFMVTQKSTDAFLKKPLDMGAKFRVSTYDYSD